ncbi:hypothetical protein U9M48_001760 [Paspalum notatum var. saurae]|uniref:Uncharacterized protein n=1 Tax=Paspalum notatum var. saurae TaxID=547442 RepID=A0AAQ3PJX7_PASNO
MERNDEKEKSEEPWTGRRVLGVAAAGAVAVAAGAFFLLSAIGDSSSRDQQEQVEADDDPPAPTRRRTMKAPGSGGKSISRDRFEENPKLYFTTLHGKGPEAAVDRIHNREDDCYKG